jgi:hypothetical protein
MDDASNKPEASPKNTLARSETVKADPSIGAPYVQRRDRIEHVRERRLVRTLQHPMLSTLSVDELIDPMLARTFRNEWVREHGHASRTVLVQEPHKRLCRTICETTGDHYEGSARYSDG